MKRNHRNGGSAKAGRNFYQRARHHSRLITTALLTLVVAGLSGTLFGQTEDVTPPALVELSIAPSMVDVTAGSATVTLTLRITDNLSGFSNGGALLISPSQGQVASGSIALPPVSGNANDGTYQSVVTISQFVEAGSWTLAFIDLSDNVGNRNLIRTPELQAAGFPTVITVNSAPDVDPPVLADLSFAPSTVDARSGPATFNVSFHITDEGSGFSNGGVLFISPSQGQVASGSIALPPVSGNANDGTYECFVTIPQFAESGTWTLAFVDLNDKVGNRALIRTPELQAAGFPTTLTVDSVQDVGPPTLSSFSFAPSTVDVSGGPGTVMITARITDDISGFGNGGVLFISPSQGQVASGSITLPPVSGNANDGTYQCVVTIPQFAESGTWTLAFVDLNDKVGNRALIRTPELQAAAFPIELRVGQEATQTPQLTALGAANIWLGLKNSDDVGTKFDLLAEVLKNGSVVGSGQLNGVAGGSSGFNNAVLRTINLALPSPASVGLGDTLSIRLSVRIAAGVAGHRSGTARLWFNDALANSRFDATIDGVTSDYFLLNGFALSATTGLGPKQTRDVFVDRAVGGNPFKPFGTWNKTF